MLEISTLGPWSVHGQGHYDGLSTIANHDGFYTITSHCRTFCVIRSVNSKILLVRFAVSRDTMEHDTHNSSETVTRAAVPNGFPGAGADQGRIISIDDLRKEIGVNFSDVSSTPTSRDSSIGCHSVINGEHIADCEKVGYECEVKTAQESDIWTTTDLNMGLMSGEVELRLKEHGWNRLSEEQTKWMQKFFSFFKGPIQYVMFAAAVLAGGLRDWVDFGVIFALLILNATVGFFQEYQAGSVVAELKKSLALEATVLRNGKEQTVPAERIVPGDILCLFPGSIVAADARIIDNSEYFLLVDQSSITGESFAAEKRKRDDIFASSLIKMGNARALVINTGNKTCVAQTADLVSKASQGTGHFTKVLTQIGTILLGLVMFALTIIWVSGFYRATTTEALLRYTLAITIVGVPVGLPAVITTTVAVGAAYLAKKKAIVRKLTAIESLAGVEILCSDKTGTLTLNQLSLKRAVTMATYDADCDLMLTACLTLNQPLDPIDTAFSIELLSSKQYPVTSRHLSDWTVTKFQPFDPVSKLVLAHVQSNNGEKMICAKGAPSSIARLVSENPVSGHQFDYQNPSISADALDTYNCNVQKYALRGYRTIGVARKLHGKRWELLGLVPCYDPPRKDTAWTISEAKRLGLKIKMLTGDDVGIAKETSRQLGLGTRIYQANMLPYNQVSVSSDIGSSGNRTMYASPQTACSLANTLSVSEETLSLDVPTRQNNNGARKQSETIQWDSFAELIEGADGFAEVFPEHKHNIVEVLQNRGYLVAMTGDGVNDAPSLKRADTGIAVEGATNAAQVAADIVFLAPGLSAIIDALKTSRQIFHRMYAYILYRIALSLHLEIFLGLWMVILDRSLKIELVVFIAIFADIATLAIAYDDAPVLRAPAKWNLPKIWFRSVVLGVILAIGTWITLSTTLVGHSGIIEGSGNIDAVLFLQIALSENWLIFITRANGPFWSKLPSWQLLMAVGAVDIIATSFCACGWFTGEPTSVLTIMRVWLFSIGLFVLCGATHFMIDECNLFQRSYRDITRCTTTAETLT